MGVTITAGSVTSAAETGSASTDTAESKSTGTATSGSTSASTGGMPQMTGDVKALFGGAAVAIAAAFV